MRRQEIEDRIDTIREGMKANRIPERMWGGLIHYVRWGSGTGGFLRAVLSNDLEKAVSRADGENMHLLPNYVTVVFNYLPMDCWGSPDKVNVWKGLEPADEDVE